MRTALAAHLIGSYTVDRWQPPARTPSLDARRLKRVLDFIEAHLASDISLDDLAAEACLSPFHFSRLFREATGLSPCRYVTDRRIQAAQKMLAVEQSSLVQVALDTGFGSQGNFTRAFRKATGLTPGQYRELCLR
jgi:AraC family transcriptional regulator